MIPQHIKSILCLDGKLPSRSFFTEDKIIVAADGAANKLLKIGINSDIIIGDLDSVNLKNHQDAKIIKIIDQDKSDFQKALKYLEENNLLPCIVCGVNGGFIDHILNNISIVAEHNCMFYDPPLMGYIIPQSSKLNIKLAINSKISLLAMPRAKAKTSGLKWDLNNELLEFSGANSLSNRASLENISIEATEGKILALVYLEMIEDAGSAE